MEIESEQDRQDSLQSYAVSEDPSAECMDFDTGGRCFS